jgi:two-component system invasion response regulator UvrY
MPGVGGLEVIRRIIQRDARAKVMVFSVHEGPVHVVRAKEAGAKGYVSKRCASRVVLEAVRALAKGETYFAPISDAVVDQAIPNFEEEVDPFASLTAREFEVCRLLAEGNAVVNVADTLHISPSTVGVHQTRILHKLHVKNSAQLARLAMRYGLVEP